MITKTMAHQTEMKGLMFIGIHPGWVRTKMGTKDALIEADESVSKMLRVVRNIKEKQNGLFLCHDGSVLQY